MTHHTDAERAEFEKNYRDRNEGSTLYCESEWRGWQAARRAPAAPVPHEPPFWFPHLRDRADGVAGHYAIARRNPGKNFLEYISPLGNWVGYGAQVFSLEDAQEWMKNSALAAAPQPPDATVNDSLTVEAAPVQLPEPVAKVEDGGLKWHIPDSGYSLPVRYLQGTHKLYTEQQVRELLANHGIQEQST